MFETEDFDLFGEHAHFERTDDQNARLVLEDEDGNVERYHVGVEDGNLVVDEYPKDIEEPSRVEELVSVLEQSFSEKELDELVDMLSRRS
jgi:hypothetical protein